MKKGIIKLIALVVLSSAAFTGCAIENRGHRSNYDRNHRDRGHDRWHDDNHNHYYHNY